VCGYLLYIDMYVLAYDLIANPVAYIPCAGSPMAILADHRESAELRI
jgi:hypothetical protein